MSGLAGPPDVGCPLSRWYSTAARDACRIIEAAREDNPWVRASGEIKEDGSFSLNTLHEGVILKGVQPGRYQARLILIDDDGTARRRASQALDPRFLDFQKSGLTFEVPTEGEVVLKMSARQGSQSNPPARRKVVSHTHGLRVFVSPSQADIGPIIREQGHSVQTLGAGQLLAEAARAGMVDLVVVDADAPGDAQLLSKVVRDVATRRKPMVVAVGNQNGAVCEAALRAAGVDLLLYKPVDLEMLIGFLRRFQAVLAEFEAFDPVI